MKKLLVILLAVLMLFGVFAASASAAGISFTDVKTSDWFYDDVKNAVGMGLVNGKTPTTYCPNDFMTYAEATKLAACMHEKYTTGKITLANATSGKWYDTYVDYAKSNGIVSQDFNWDAQATRAGYMSIFAHALPDSAFAAINNVPDNTIPDVTIGSYYGKDIYKLYRAGIVQGVDAKYNCNPGSNIKRSEVAAILTRMMDSSARKSFSTVPGELLGLAAQPKDAATSVGGDASFSVKASGGTPPYSYEWHRIVANNGNKDVVLDADEGLITGTQTGTITTKQCKDTENGDKYYCIVSDSAGGFIVSEKATLTVSAAALTITKEPSNTSVEVDGTAKFSVKVSGGTEPYTYEWHRVIKSGSFAGDDYALDDNDVFPGASTANLSVKHCASGENGDQYYCIVKDANGNKVTTKKATLKVNVAAPTVKISDDKLIFAGNDATFTVTVSGGSGSYSYQWHRIVKDNNDYDVPLSDGGNTPGARTASLTTCDCKASENGDRYYCVVTDNVTGKTTKSPEATLIVIEAHHILF